MKSEIKELIYKNLFHEHRLMWIEDEDEEAGDPDVVKHLILAYLACSATEAGGERTPECLDHDQGYALMLKTYTEEYSRLLLRRGIKNASEESIMEGFDWPDVMPTDINIPKGVLVSMAKRMAAYDEKTSRDIKAYYLEEEKKRLRAELAALESNEDKGVGG